MKYLNKYYNLLTIFILLSIAASGATFTVTTASDNASGWNPAQGAGTGTFRQAIVDAAGGGAGPHTIDFNIAAAGPHTISLLHGGDALPSISNTTINGFSQTGASANSNAIFSGSINAVYQIIIATSSNSWGNYTPLLTLGSNNVIKGLVFKDGFSTGTLISILGSGNQVIGCYIGMSSTGTTYGGGNCSIGILINNVANNIIGDGTDAGANVISGIGNSGVGVKIMGVNATGNTVKGNIIGLQKDGSTKVATNGQAYGIQITFSNPSTPATKIATSANSNTIGGTGAKDGNVISGNTSAGIFIDSKHATLGNTIIGNRIGMQRDGITVIAATNPQEHGIVIHDAKYNTIGGNSSSHRNIISGNEDTGILLYGSSSTNNTIKGNYIGPQVGGAAFITGSTQTLGIRCTGVGTGNTIGGTGANEGNLISGNTFTTSPGFCISRGIAIYGGTSGGVTVVGNTIGTNASGTDALTGLDPDDGQCWGMVLDSTVTGITIGGTTSGARNIISGNGSIGIQIGLTANNCTGNFIKGNYIGLQPDGITMITGNTQSIGILITSNNGSNTVGGSSYNERNIISGNNTTGINIASNSNTVTRNIIGLTKNGGVVTSSSQDYGIYINAASSNIIGGNSSSYRNIISGNGYGVFLQTSGSSNVIKGNYIGTDSTGTALTNSQTAGIYFAAGSSNTIGGTGAGEGNVISANVTGIDIRSSSSNTIVGNTIGPQVGGNAAIASNPQTTGIYLSDATSTVIGGNITTTPLARNYISGNTNDGIYITGASSTGITIQGNYIGTNTAGTGVVGSQNTGIELAGGGSNTIGGGTGSGVLRNIISGNTQYGIYASSTNSNIVKGNYIGPASDLTNITGDTQTKAIYLLSNCESWQIGGTATGEGNTIAYNSSIGIELRAASVKYIKMLRNLIYTNGSSAISHGSVGNQTKAAPTITNWSDTLIVGTATAGDIIELFTNTTNNAWDVTEYIGTATANGSGAWRYTETRSLRALEAGEYLLATGTDVSNNTSELTAPKLLTLPIELNDFNVNCSDNKIIVTWSTARETNNDYFTIERTSNEIDDKKEFIVDGAGNSTEMNKYTFIDPEPLSGTSYYRLKQTDFDGKFEYFDFVATNCNEDESEVFNIYPNPNGGESVNLSISSLPNKEIIVVLYDVLGRETFSKVLLSNNEGANLFVIDINNKLASGIYTLVASSLKSVYKTRLIIK